MFAALEPASCKLFSFSRIAIKSLMCLILMGGIAVANTPSNQIFTFQGRLYDDGAPADGEYDLVFCLLDGPEPNEANPVTWEEFYYEYPVSEGYFTVDLNFAPFDKVTEDELFDGSERWLRIGIRPGEFEDPNDYTYLYPLTKLNAVPFSHLAYRLRAPAVLRSDSNEPVLTIADEGSGAGLYFAGESGLMKYEKDAAVDIGNSETRSVGLDSTESIVRDRTLTIDRNESKSVGGDSTSMVTLDRSSTVGVSDETIVGGVSAVSAGSDMNRSSGKDLNLEAGRNINLTAAGEIKSLSLLRVTGSDPNKAVLVDGVLNLKPKANLPPANGTYGMLYVKEGKLYYQDDDDLFLITAGGASPQRICFSVKRDKSYDWPDDGMPHVVEFGKGSSVWYSVGGGFDPNTGSFVAPTRGIYSFNGSVTFRNLSGNDQIYAELQCGPRTYRGDYKFVRAYTESATVNVTVYLEPGDVVQLRAFVWAVSPPAEVFGNTSPTHAFTYFNGAKVD